MNSITESTPDAQAHGAFPGLNPFSLVTKPPVRSPWFWRIEWIDDLLAVPHWAPEGDFSLALRARELQPNAEMSFAASAATR